MDIETRFRKREKYLSCTISFVISNPDPNQVTYRTFSTYRAAYIRMSHLAIHSRVTHFIQKKSFSGKSDRLMGPVEVIEK